MPYKKVYYTIKCPKCNKEYQVLSQAYFRKQKDTKYGAYCKSCRAKVQWEEMTEEEKKLMNQKAHEANRNKLDSLSNKEKQELIDKRNEGIKNHWNNMSDKERKEISIKRSKDRKEFLSRLSKEELKNIGRKISKTKLEKSSKMSQDELDRRKLEKQEERKRYWDSLTVEDQECIISILKENNRKYWENISDEERQNRSEEMSKRNNDFWKNSSKDIIQDRKDKLVINGEIYRSNLTEEDKIILRKKRLSNAGGINNFHQKFEKMFINSLISKSYHVIREEILSNNSVIHSWDYGIYSNKNNELVMVVDLDGSYFYGDNCDYDGLHSHEEYDEKRLLSIPDTIKYSIINESSLKEGFDNMIKTLMTDYQEFIDQQFQLCRLGPFPYPKYSDDELLKSWNQLLKMDCDDKYHQDISLNTRVGDRIIQHFHQSIYYAYRKGCISPYEAWYNDDLLRKIIQNRVIYVNTLNPNKILQGFNVSKIAPKVSVFSAGRAKILIYKYLNEFSEIFDPFSGFSGRMLGCISLDKRYIGQDISEMHVKESNNIINFLNINDMANVSEKDILQSYGEYECLFTCPPYEDKEFWDKINSNIKSCDDWIDLCLSHFRCKKYLFIIDDTKKYQDCIINEINNKSHFGNNKEYIVLINNNKGE